MGLLIIKVVSFTPICQTLNCCSLITTFIRQSPLIHGSFRKRKLLQSTLSCCESCAHLLQAIFITDKKWLGKTLWASVCKHYGSDLCTQGLFLRWVSCCMNTAPPVFLPPPQSCMNQTLICPINGAKDPGVTDPQGERLFITLFSFPQPSLRTPCKHLAWPYWKHARPFFMPQCRPTENRSPR